MFQPKSFITVALFCLYCVTTAYAAEVPAPRDILYPGTLTLSVDLTDLDRRLFMVRESVPVKPGPLTLLYPQWLPGKHGPRGALAEMTGLMIRANGKTLRWTRDPVQVYAFHVDVPEGTASVDVEFQFTAPVRESEGRVNVTPNMMNVQWEQVALYPAGHFTRAIRLGVHHFARRGGAFPLDGAKITGNVR